MLHSDRKLVALVVSQCKLNTRKTKSEKVNKDSLVNKERSDKNLAKNYLLQKGKEIEYRAVS